MKERYCYNCGGDKENPIPVSIHLAGSMFFSSQNKKQMDDATRDRAEYATVRKAMMAQKLSKTKGMLDRLRIIRDTFARELEEKRARKNAD